MPVNIISSIQAHKVHPFLTKISNKFIALDNTVLYFILYIYTVFFAGVFINTLLLHSVNDSIHCLMIRAHAVLVLKVLE